MGRPLAVFMGGFLKGAAGVLMSPPPVKRFLHDVSH